MTPVPLELPLGAGDAGRLAEVIFDQAEGRPLRDDIRNRIAARLSSVRFETLRPWYGSLSADPVHPSAYFLAVDGLARGDSRPLLLRIASASTPASALFPNPLLIGRMRAGLAAEVVVSATGFGPADHDNVLRFAAEVDNAFLPRALGTRAPFAVAPRSPEVALPGAFIAFRYLLRNRGINQAVIAPAGSAPDDIQRTETAAIWSAIRAGWRDGFTLQITVDAETLSSARGYTTFIAGPELHNAIAQLKAGSGAWKRLDPDPETRARTLQLAEILDRTPAAEVSDAILEFAVP